MTEKGRGMSETGRTDGAHPVSQLPRAAGVELTVQETADLAGLGVQLIRHHLGRVTPG